MLSYGYRSQISGRLATDHRLLLAAIHSEVHPVSWLRGKCWVRHREKIENLHEWKKKPDHFHYSRLFDPYIKREYEMIRTSTVTNGKRATKPSFGTLSLPLVPVRRASSVTSHLSLTNRQQVAKVAIDHQPRSEPKLISIFVENLHSIVPDYVRRVLTKRYEFLVTEKEIVADLTDTFRTCRTCLEWASSQESVKCEYVFRTIGVITRRFRV
jgi:hypothetical protein